MTFQTGDCNKRICQNRFRMFSRRCRPVPAMPPFYSDTVFDRVGQCFVICLWQRCCVCPDAVPGQGGVAGGQYTFSCAVLYTPAFMVSLQVVTKHT